MTHDGSGQPRRDPRWLDVLLGCTDSDVGIPATTTGDATSAHVTTLQIGISA